MKLAIATRSLARGGVPVQVVNLARGVARRGHEVSVIVLYAGGALQPELEQGGITVHCLDKQGRWDMLAPMARYLAIARRERFEVIYSFLPVENLMSLLVAMRTGAASVWGLRGASQDLMQHGASSFLLWTLQRLLLRLPLRMPRAIISNSQAALRELGASVQGRWFVIPNGIDTDRFRPDIRVRAEVRAELGLQEDTPVVGCVARLDTVKDHPTLLQAAVQVRQEFPSARFVVVGGGPPAYHRELRDLSVRLGIEDALQWLGDRPDPQRVLNAFDVYVSASRAEGFSNSLAEAMACGVAPVVTDVGDSAAIVARHGTLVCPGDIASLARGVARWLAQDSPELSQARRKWIVEEFGVEHMINRTLEVLQQLRQP